MCRREQKLQTKLARDGTRPTHRIEGRKKDPGSAHSERARFFPPAVLAFRTWQLSERGATESGKGSQPFPCKPTSSLSLVV